jgi:hypothetical protein
MDVAEVRIADGREVELVLDLKLPAGAALSPDAPWSLRIETDEMALQRTQQTEGLPLQATVSGEAIRPGTWLIEASFVYCTHGETGCCIPANVAWNVPVRAGGVSRRIMLSADVRTEHS